MMKQLQRGDRRRIGGKRKLVGRAQLFRACLVGVVSAGLQFLDAVLVDVEADGRKLLSELDGQRQADIAQSDDRDPEIVQFVH